MRTRSRCVLDAQPPWPPTCVNAFAFVIPSLSVLVHRLRGGAELGSLRRIGAACCRRSLHNASLTPLLGWLPRSGKTNWGALVVVHFIAHALIEYRACHAAVDPATMDGCWLSCMARRCHCDYPGRSSLLHAHMGGRIANNALWNTVHIGSKAVRWDDGHHHC